MFLHSRVFQGYIEACAEQCLRVLYLPGVPHVFEKQVQLKVAFLPPQDITLTGEGVFPRISLSLPQNLCMHRPTPINTVIISLPKDIYKPCNMHVCYLLLFLFFHPKSKMVFTVD